MNKILLFFITILFSLNAYAVTNVTFWHMEGVPHRVDRIQTLIDAVSYTHLTLPTK